MQNAGDLVYLPANWKHMTLNIGESIGVGGQAVYSGEVRRAASSFFLLRVFSRPFTARLLSWSVPGVFVSLL